MLKFLSLIVVLVAMLLCGSLAAPVAKAGPLGFFGTADRRARERTFRAQAKFGAPVHGARVLFVPGGGHFVPFGGQTIIIR